MPPRTDTLTGKPEIFAIIGKQKNGIDVSRPRLVPMTQTRSDPGGKPAEILPSRKGAPVVQRIMDAKPLIIEIGAPLPEVVAQTLQPVAAVEQATNFNKDTSGEVIVTADKLGEPFGTQLMGEFTNAGMITMGSENDPPTFSADPKRWGVQSKDDGGTGGAAYPTKPKPKPKDT